MLKEDIKYIKALLKGFNKLVAINNKLLKNNTITSDDYLTSLIEESEFNIRRFKDRLTK